VHGFLGACQKGENAEERRRRSFAEGGDWARQYNSEGSNGSKKDADGGKEGVKAGALRTDSSTEH
jgi:hypothetical protein